MLIIPSTTSPRSLPFQFPVLQMTTKSFGILSSLKLFILSFAECEKKKIRKLKGKQPNLKSFSLNFVLTKKLRKFECFSFVLGSLKLKFHQKKTFSLYMFVFHREKMEEKKFEIVFAFDVALFISLKIMLHLHKSMLNWETLKLSLL